MASGTIGEKDGDVAHIEETRRGSGGAIDKMRFDDERVPEARGRDLDALPKSYWISPLFVGSYIAIGCGFAAATGGFALVAPLLTVINDDLGPSDNITWVALVYLLCQAVFFLIVGRLTDIFGRRWFFISGSVIGLIGSILGATATSINQMIAAELFIGIASGFQISFFWVVAELVPMKYRYIASSGLYFITFPTNPLAAKVALTIYSNTGGWRGCFYLLIGANGLSVLCWYFFYHPPTFKMLHRRTAAKELVKRFDWLGLLLFTGSLLIFLLGLNWGGSVYPWNSGAVIGVLVAGAVGMIVFTLWEIFLPRWTASVEPFLPLHLFRNLRYMSCAWLTAIGAAVYYGFSLIWPQCVALVYTDIQSEATANTLSGLAPMCFVIGQIVGGVVGTFTGPKPFIIFTMTTSAPILAAAAANPLDKNLTMGLMITGCLLIGSMECMSIATTTFPLRTQEEIGTAGGLSGSIRAFGSVIAIAVFSTTLRNRLAVTIPANVVPAATHAGLPASSIPSLISGLTGITKLNDASVPDLTPSILSAASQAYRVANSQAFSTVFLVSFAFGGVGMILAWFVAQNDASTENFVSSHIHNTKDEKALEAQEG